MPKRKLSDFTDNAPSQDQHQNQNLKLQTTRLKQKFDFGVTALSRALKAARGFERQKLGRRQKTAKAPAENAKPNANPEETAKRIEREIAILKTLDPTATAEKYLFKQLAKTKRIAEAPIFYRFKQSKKLAVEGPKSAEEANVTARLFKSNPVKNVLPEIMDGLRGLFGLEEAQGKTKGKDGGSGKATKDDGAASRKSGSVERRAALDVSGSESESESGDAVRDVEMEDAGSDEGDYSRFDARLASDSEDNDDDDVASDDDQLRARSGAQLGRSDMSVSLSPSPSRSPSPSQSPPQKKPKSQTKAPATSTTFLPSLMMGGYWSGSESEPEEVEEAPKRKNRMGQQARRALWEKKYGASANHVKEQQKGGKKGRDSGWDLRKGATGDGDNGRRKFGTGSNATAVVGEKKFGQSGAGKETQGRPSNKKPDDNKPLHPSWEAARKAKEQKSTASFQGKKLVFD